MKPAVIYARVSSDRQREEHTIASQTEALRVFAQQQGFSVPDEWVIEDEGYSGATLVRPGLERVRDLAAEGQIDAVLVYSPDRLSRKYAYQVLLIEELARHNVKTLFVKSPQTATPEDQLLLQFQGMIAEYERAQILERSRRGKRHRALQGAVNVLSGAPYGYRYIRKSEHSPASYAIIDVEAAVVRLVFEQYTVHGLSIGAIANLLNERGVPTRKRVARWERSTVWGMLRNPAYKGAACFNKTKLSKRQRITRPIRLRGGIAKRDSAGHERPREEWIEIPVPAIVAEETFALAAERLQANKDHAPRRTATPSVLQGLVSCRKCGYGLYRTSTRSTARKIYYYRCFGSDGWRHLSGPKCDSKPIRQDLVDEAVWREVIKLLEDPHLIQEELNRRLTVARNSGPTKSREDTLQRELTRIQGSIERLMTAYQEDLLSLDDLRRRMPELRKREQAIHGELNAIESQITDRAAYLRLADTLTNFLARLREAVKTLDMAARQRIVRLVVKEVLVGDDKIVIRHSIPTTSSPTGSEPSSPRRDHQSAEEPSYLLRKWSSESIARQHLHEPLPETLATHQTWRSVPRTRHRLR
jgi:site-specific DNA recombinase